MTVPPITEPDTPIAVSPREGKPRKYGHAKIKRETKKRIVAETKRLNASVYDLQDWVLEISAGVTSDLGQLNEGQAGVLLVSLLGTESRPVAAAQPDVDRAFSRFLTGTKERPSHGGLHVSDVANGCGRAVHARIFHGVKPEFNAVQRCKMEQGFQIEDLVRRAMVKGLAPAYKLVKSGAVVFNPGEGSVSCIPLSKAKKVAPFCLVGHDDLVFEAVDGSETIVGEVKSTQWYRSGYLGVTAPTKDELRIKNQNYILQGAAYAKARNAERYFVIVVDRGTGQWATYWFKTDEEWPAFQRRWEMMMAATRSEAAPPPSLPEWTIKKDGTSYLCMTCPVKSCSLNPARLLKSLKSKNASLASTAASA